ncbi:MAG: hypothetical protein ACOYL3_09610 [Desulfuromonadaceae bacterium]
MKLDRRTASESQIEHFNHHRESHGKINISFGDMHIKTIADQSNTNQKEKAECLEEYY